MEKMNLEQFLEQLQSLNLGKISYKKQIEIIKEFLGSGRSHQQILLCISLLLLHSGSKAA